MKRLILLCCYLFLSLNTYASSVAFHGDLRERITHLSAVEFDETSPEAGTFWTQRITFGANVQLTEHLSFNGSLLSALQEGVEASPIERNNLDIYESYIAYQSSNITMALGRQTLKLGSQRLIGWRDGTNVRRSWDGLRVTVKHSDTRQSDWFAMSLVDVEPNGVFNDETSSDNFLAGSYFTSDTSRYNWFGAHQSQLEFYYLYTNRDARGSIEGQANQLRHTLGVRFEGDSERWFWDWEAAYQVGRHGEFDIRAWTIASNTGFRFHGEWEPEVMLSLNVASGDDEREDGRLETFDALYPRGSYFSESAQLGPANFYNIHPYLFLYPTESVRLQLDLNMYWRLETNDGVYGPPGNIIQAPTLNDDKAVNIAFSAGVEWELNHHWNISLLATYSRPQGFLESTQNHTDAVKFVEFTVNWQFL